MDEKNQTGKQPRTRSRAGIVWLIILAVLIGGAGFLYYSIVKAPLALDDPWELADSAPLSPEERFRFSAADQTIEVRLDKGDIWRVILDIAGDGFIDQINEEIASYNLSVAGCAICMDEDGLRMDMECYFKETRLVVRIPCEVRINGQQFSLTPTGLKLGVIPVPVSGLLSKLELEHELSLPAIGNVTQIRIEQDAIVLTGSMEQDMLALVPADKKLDQAAVFAEGLQPLVDALRDEDGYTAILNYLEKNPAGVEKLYRDLFILADSGVTDRYLEDRHGLTQRFFPEIDYASLAEEQEMLGQELSSMNELLEQFFTHVVNSYNEKQFRLSDGQFLKNGVPFQAAQFGDGQYDGLFEVLDSESVFLILVDVEDGYLRKTSSFYRMADENQQFTQSVDYNKTYILGCVIRSVDAEPYLLYEAERTEANSYYRQIVLQALTEENVKALQEPGKFGVWTG